MMKIIILGILAVSFPFWSVTQVVTNQSGVGGSENETVANIVFNEHNEIFVLSWSKSPNDGNISISGIPQNDWYFYLVKYDANLSILWQKGYGGDGVDTPSSIISTNDGLLIAGSTSSTQNTGNKTVPNYGSSDFWLIKTDYDGEILWQKTYGGNDSQGLNTIVALDNNEYILSGGSRSNTSGVKTEDSYGGLDYWLIKIDAAGEIIWDKTIGSEGEDRNLTSIRLSNNNILVAGSSTGALASGLKTEPNNSPLEDIWLVCLDTDGNILWDKVLGGLLYESYAGITNDDNYIYAFIESWSDVSGQRTAPRKGGRDIWAVKLDFDGNIIWDKAYGGSGTEEIGDVFFDNDRIYVAATSASDISIDKTEDSKGYFDYWPFTITTDGDMIEQKTIGGDTSDFAKRIIKHNDKVYILGASASGVSGDKTSPNFGWNDVWLVEIDAATLGLKSNFSISDISIYPNPAVDEVTIKLNNVELERVEIIDMSGRLIKTKNISNTYANTVSISTSELTAGVYSINLIGKHFLYTKQLVKE